MSTFELYLKLGMDHLLDINGYDHMLFLMAMILGYKYRDWKKLVGLVTAFTLGHTTALILSMVQIVSINSVYIEFSILLSIALLAMLKFLDNGKLKVQKRTVAKIYPVLLLFGIIHGLGFSNYLKAIFAGSDFWIAIIGFNVGLEIAQFGFVCVALLPLTILNRFFDKYVITKVISFIITAWAIYLLITF